MNTIDGLDLKIERIRRQLPQWKVAAAAGMTQSVLCAIENGRRPLTDHDAETIRRTIASLDDSTLPRAPHERVS